MLGVTLGGHVGSILKEYLEVVDVDVIGLKVVNLEVVNLEAVTLEVVDQEGVTLETVDWKARSMGAETQFIG
jgi:hypothetical protein